MASYAMIAPAFSSQAQAYCIASEIDFLDLAGNVFISVPGQFTAQRTAMRGQEEPSSSGLRITNVFSGRPATRGSSLYTLTILGSSCAPDTQIRPPARRSLPIYRLIWTFTRRVGES
jgi:hypothetical protein